MRYVIDSPIKPQRIFELIKERAGVDYGEMYSTFNMGMGFVIVAPEDCEEDIKREIPDTKVVGHVEPGRGVEIPEYGVRFEKY